MKKIILIMVIILFFLVVNLTTEEVIPLPEINKPAGIAVQGAQLYISEGTKIHLLSLDSKKLTKSFGNEGEGPKEFKVNPGFGVSVHFSGNYLQVNSSNKLTLFSPKGEYLREKKTGKRSKVLYIDGNYLGHSFTFDKVNLMSLAIFDSKMVSLKNLATWKHAIQDSKKEIDLSPEYTDYYFVNHKIYVAPNAKFLIDIYDYKGKKLSSLTHPYKRLKITAQYKNTTLNFFKTDKRWSNQWSFLKDMFIFKNHFPAIKMFFVDKTGIYVQTYHRAEGKSEFLLFSLKGKYLRTKMIPFIESMGVNILPLHTVANGSIYQLIENEEKERWEIRVHKF